MLTRISVLSLAFAIPALAAPAAKVDVCHKGDAGFQVINISGNAAQAHLNHGDAYPATWYVDADGDGFGDSAAATDRCPQAGLVDNGNDCNDGDAAVNPDATEVAYDGVDNDCSATTADDDLDSDGFNLVDDCNDADAAVNPNAPEAPYDGVDNDCNASTPDDDIDADGFGIADDCNDDNELVNPSAAEVCGDSMDNNCDATIDEGCAVAGDCPCFTSELIMAEYESFRAQQFNQYSYASCDVVSYDYYYGYDLTQLYFYGGNFDGTTYSQEGDYFYSLDYDYYYNQTFCHGASYDYSYNYQTGENSYSNDFYSFQFLTEEQHAGCEALLVDVAAAINLTCNNYGY